MKELVKRLSVPIAEMGACMVMVCLLPSCSVASLFHEEIGKEEAMVLMADSTRYVGKTFLPDFQGKSFRLVTDEGKRVKIKSGEVVTESSPGCLFMCLTWRVAERKANRVGLIAKVWAGI